MLEAAMAAAAEAGRKRPKVVAVTVLTSLDDGDLTAVGQRGPAAQDTADWRDHPGPGNMRVDYVLPSTGLTITGAGVFWPKPDNPLARLIAPDPTGGRRPVSSDHRLVWVDIALSQE